MAENTDYERGSILIYVLMIAIVMSMMIAASITLINAAIQNYTISYYTTQAFYNAQAGIAVGEYDLENNMKNFNTNQSTVSDIEITYPLNTSVHDASGSQNPSSSNPNGWDVTVELTNVTNPTNGGTQYTLNFTITSKGIVNSTGSGSRSYYDTLYAYVTDYYQ